MKRPLAAAFGLSLLTAFAAAATPTVHTDLGPVRGVEGQGVRAFKGIPYAQPPIGALRFEPPRPATAWAGVLDGTQYRSACPQVSRFNLTDASDDENCLFLNITTPTARSPRGAKRPVI